MEQVNACSVAVSKHQRPSGCGTSDICPSSDKPKRKVGQLSNTSWLRGQLAAISRIHV